MVSRGLAWPSVSVATGGGLFRLKSHRPICNWMGGPCMMRMVGEQGGSQFVGCALDCELDLGFMVRDFLESRSVRADSICSSDGDSGSSDFFKFLGKISFFIHDMDQREIQLLSLVRSLILSINDTNLNYAKVKGCNASCIRQKLVRLLKLSGIDAALCTSKWQGTSKIPGGEYEYIDVFLEDNTTSTGRLIVDIDFPSNFEIARAVKSYDTLLSTLPLVYVGYDSKLKRYLSVMVDAAKTSLKQNSMPLPPWRSLAYLQAKWQSTPDRKTNQEELINSRHSDRNLAYDCHEQCIVHLKRLKSSISIEKG